MMPNYLKAAVSLDGRLLAVTGHTVSSIRLIDTESGHVVNTLHNEVTTIDSLTFSDNGSRIIACSTSGEVLSWDLTANLDLFALKWAEVLREAEPESLRSQAILGAAQFRCGLVQEALATAVNSAAGAKSPEFEEYEILRLATVVLAKNENDVSDEDRAIMFRSFWLEWWKTSGGNRGRDSIVFEALDYLSNRTPASPAPSENKANR